MNSTIPIGPTINSAFKLFTESLPWLIKVALPLILVSEALVWAGHQNGNFVSFWLSFCGSIVRAYLGILVVKYFLLHVCGDREPKFPIGIAMLCIFIFISGYNQVATVLGGFLFLNPLLPIYACLILAPVIVVDVGAGPIESIAESARRVKGNVWLISGILLIVGTHY